MRKRGLALVFCCMKVNFMIKFSWICQNLLQKAVLYSEGAKYEGKGKLYER